MYSGWQLITRLSGGILRCWWVLDDGRQVSARFHPSPFIKDGLIPGIPNGWVPPARIGCDCENLSNT